MTAPIRWRGIDPCRAMYSYGTEVRAMGYQIVPIRSGMKRPTIRGWPTIEADPRDIAKWIVNDGRSMNGSSIGIVTTRTPVLDVDCMDPEFIAEFKARIWEAFGCPPVRVGRAPKIAMLFRTLEPFKKEASASYINSEGHRAQLEILGQGQQFVAYGIHPDTGKPYEWTTLQEPLGIRADQLTILTAEMREQAIAVFEEMCEARGWQRKGRSKGVQRGLAESGDDGPKDRLGLTMEELREIVMMIPNLDNSIEYEGPGLTWINVEAAIHHESGGSAEGYEIGEEWSIQSPKHNSHDEDRLSIAWPSFKPDHPNPRTARSLIAWAREFNPDLWMASDVDAVDAALGDAAESEPRKPASSKGVEIHTGEQIIMEAVEWIWPGYLARGKFHVLGGQKGAGKSTITFSFAATITKVDGKWPDGRRAPLGNVLIWSGEDDMSDTIMPRIAAMGGDIKRVHFVKSITDQGKKRRFDPATDLPRLVEAMRAVRDLRMVIIDPIVSASKNDSHKNAETRRGLQPVVDLAEELRVVVIGLTHFTKNTQGKDPIERITGTLAFGALPRVVFGAAMSKDADAIRRFVRIASNIGPSGGGFEYALDQKIVPGHDFTNQIVKWSGSPLVGSAIDLIGNIESPQSQKLMAGEFLTQMLTDAGAAGVDVPDLKKAAEANGLTWITVIRAKNDLGNISAKKREGIAHGAWYWLIGNEHGYDDEPL